MTNRPFVTRSREETELLLEVHKMEEARIAGPGSSRRDIRDVLWTLDQACREIGLDDDGRASLESLIAYMHEMNQIMIVPAADEGAPGYITRTAETIRLLGHTYEYWHKGRPGADAVRWLPVAKKIPERNITHTEIISRLDSDLDGFYGGERGAQLKRALHEVVEGLSAGLGGKAGAAGARYSEFQYRATRDMLLSSLGSDEKRTQVLTAGVGSGKTIGFLMATLILARHSELMNEWGVDLILYPRTALAKDQFNTLKAYAANAQLSQTPPVAVHSEMSEHYRTTLGSSVRNGVPAVHRGVGGPLVIVSTMETLKRRLQNPDFVQGVMPRLRRVIIDEVHLVNGSQGAHVATLMRRLRRLSGRDIEWTASSATIASPEEHASRLFEVDPKSVDIVRPEDEELITDGIQNHVFVRPSGRISNLGLLVNMTSILLHSRRDDLSDKPNTDLQIEQASKAIGFADNLDILGRWNSDLMENERTENREIDDGYTRPHPTNENPVATGRNRWSRQQREIPYAARFQEPLQRRIESEGGRHETEQGREVALLPVLEEHRGSDLCKRCKSGERITLGHADELTMSELGKLVHRIEHHQEDPFKPFMINHDIFSQEQDEIGTLDLCPYLRSGACTWFAKSDPSATSMIPGTDNNRRYEFTSVARSSVFSSKSERTGDDEDLSSQVYKDTLEKVYQLPRQNNVTVDMVLASPTLEVGIDLPNLTESVMVNAIRNMASYRQKVGRVGREPNLDTINSTLVTDSALDLHYYRQPKKLVEDGRLEPVPLKERNQSIVLCGLYQAVWDWLALESTLPEVVPTTWRVPATVSDFRAMLEQCVADLTVREGHVAAHLSAVCGGMFAPNSREVLDAIGQAGDELGAFLRPAASTKTFTSPLDGDYTVADVIARILSSNDTPDTPSQLRRDVRNLVVGRDSDWSNLSMHRRNLSPLEGRGRISQEALGILDRLFRCKVQDPVKLADVKRQLQANLARHADDGQETSHEILERFVARFDDVHLNVRLLDEDGWDPLAHQMITQYAEMDSNDWKRGYFSTIRQTLSCLRILQRKEWYIEPSTFFQNPYDEEVELCGQGIPDSQKFIAVSEALHSFIPGSFTYRLPQSCYKVLCRGMEPTPRSVSFVNRQRLEGGGTQSRLTREAVPGPPGMPGGTHLDIYTPTKIWLKREPRKYIFLNPEEGLLRDGDDMPANRTSDRDIRIKVPRTFNNRWTYLEDQPAPDIKLVDPSLRFLGELGVQDEGTEKTGQEAANNLDHPLTDNHLASIRWHDKLEVTEFVYSSTRAYSTDNGWGAEVRYRDEIGAIAWGEAYDTEGLTMELEQSSTRNSVNRILDEASEGSGAWTPTILKAFSSYLSQLPVMEGDEATFGHFEIQDIIAIIIASAGEGDLPLDQNSVVEAAVGLNDDPDRLRSIVRRRILALMGQDDPENLPEGGPEHDTDTDLEERVGGRLLLVEQLVQALRVRINEFAEEFLPLWLHRSILMGLGVSSVTALQRIAGSQTSDVGYAIDPDSWDGRGQSVHLYDRSHYGNGNCRVAKEHMYIPSILRHRLNDNSRMLPTSDFLSTLEEALLQCMQHHSDMSALSLHSSAGEPTALSMALQDVEAHARETLDVAEETWNDVGVSGPSDAWKIPLKFHIRKELAVETGLPADDVTRATKFCYHGCPECIDRLDIVLGGVHGMPYLDKAVLDVWYQEGRKHSPEYHDLSLSSMADGSSGLQFGVLHNVHLDIQGRRIRSSTMPWTIGLHIERSDPDSGAKIVIRESDVSGRRLIEAPGQSVIMGTQSVGIKRRLWFDLMMTAYLDAAGELGDSERRIDLVYFDIRDIEFDDTGLTPRMLDSIVSLGKPHGFSRFDNLSDVLAWMAHRGFEIRVCVDSERAREGGVKDFLDKLREQTSEADGSVEILCKSVDYGSMHLKLLLTPIWGMLGSANMTPTGLGLSDELQQHVLATDPNYAQLVQRCEDIMHGATEYTG